MTYIKPVFDCRVQHGEVCEEDPQVGHRALGAGLYGRKENTHNLQKKGQSLQRFFPFFSFSLFTKWKKTHKKGRLQSGRLQLVFKRALMIQHILHTHTL